jgi:hypothetical protein
LGGWLARATELQCFSRFLDHEAIKKIRTFKMSAHFGIHSTSLRTGSKAVPFRLRHSAYWPRRAGPERMAPGWLVLTRARPLELRPAEKPPAPGRLRKPFLLLPLYGLLPRFLAWV